MINTDFLICVIILLIKKKSQSFFYINQKNPIIYQDYFLTLEANSFIERLLIAQYHLVIYSIFSSGAYYYIKSHAIIFLQSRDLLSSIIVSPDKKAHEYIQVVWFDTNKYKTFLII